MKIIKQTFQELVLKKNHSVSFFFLFGLFFGGLPLIMLFSILYNIGPVTVQCQRIEPTHIDCEINSSKLLGFVSHAPIQISQVKKADYQTRQHTDSEGDTLTDHEVVITYKKYNTFLLQSDSMYINGDKGDAEQMRSFADELTRFLGNTEKISWHSRLSNWMNLFLILIFIPFLAIGGGMMIYSILNAGSEKFTFDKIARNFYYQNTSRLKKEDTVIPIADIDKLVLEESKDSDGDTTLTLFLTFKHNRKYELDSGLHEIKIKELANAVKDFLPCDLQQTVKK